MPILNPPFNFRRFLCQEYPTSLKDLRITFKYISNICRAEIPSFLDPVEIAPFSLFDIFSTDIHPDLACGLFVLKLLVPERELTIGSDDDRPSTSLQRSIQDKLTNIFSGQPGHVKLEAHVEADSDAEEDLSSEEDE